MNVLILCLLSLNLYAGVLTKYLVHSSYSSLIEKNLLSQKTDIERISYSKLEIFSRLNESELSAFIKFPHTIISAIQGKPLRALRESESSGLSDYMDASETLKEMLTGEGIPEYC